MNIDTYRETRYYTYFIKIEVFYYPENYTHNLEISNLDTNPTYILETNHNYYDFYTLPDDIHSIIGEEQVIAIYLRNNNNTGYTRYTL